MREDDKFYLYIALIAALTILGCCGLAVQCDMHRADAGFGEWVPGPGGGYEKRGSR